MSQNIISLIETNTEASTSVRTSMSTYNRRIADNVYDARRMGIDFRNDPDFLRQISDNIANSLPEEERNAILTTEVSNVRDHLSRTSPNPDVSVSNNLVLDTNTSTNANINVGTNVTDSVLNPSTSTELVNVRDLFSSLHASRLVSDRIMRDLSSTATIVASIPEPAVLELVDTNITNSVAVDTAVSGETQAELDELTKIQNNVPELSTDRTERIIEHMTNITNSITGLIEGALDREVMIQGGIIASSIIVTDEEHEREMERIDNSIQELSTVGNVADRIASSSNTTSSIASLFSTYRGTLLYSSVALYFCYTFLPVVGVTFFSDIVQNAFSSLTGQSVASVPSESSASQIQLNISGNGNTISFMNGSELEHSDLPPERAVTTVVEAIARGTNLSVPNDSELMTADSSRPETPGTSYGAAIGVAALVGAVGTIVKQTVSRIITPNRIKKVFRFFKK